MPGTKVLIADEGRRLLLPTGNAEATPSGIDAATLWRHCPSALRRRQRLDGRTPPAPAGVLIVRATPIGNYALNIAFSDGHDRGVYPWSLLEQLSRRPDVSDFLIAFDPPPAATPAVPSSLA